MVKVRVLLSVGAVAACVSQGAWGGVVFMNSSRELDPPTGLASLSSLMDGAFDQSISQTNYALGPDASVTLDLSQHSVIGPGSVQYTGAANMTLDSTGNQTVSALSTLATTVVLDEPMTISSTLAATTDGNGWSADATLSDMSTSYPLVGVPDFVLAAGTYTLNISNGVFLNGFLPSGSVSLSGTVNFTPLPAPGLGVLVAGMGLFVARRRRS